MNLFNLLKIFVVGLIFNLILIPSAKAASFNVAQGANVTLNGTFFVEGWAGAYKTTVQSVVDGNFLSTSHVWDQDTVWWNTNLANGTYQTVQIDLTQTYSIDSFIVQADDNDDYNLYYLNIDTNAWDSVWNIPVAGGWGMQTRPDKANNTVQYILSTPIVTNALRIGAGNYGDVYKSVSEIQAFGTPTTPEPSSLILGFLGVIGLFMFSNSRKQFIQA